ncbi:MAG: hypothetical protein RR547_08670 [Raoultibacter sp.]
MSNTNKAYTNILAKGTYSASQVFKTTKNAIVPEGEEGSVGSEYGGLMATIGVAVIVAGAALALILGGAFDDIGARITDALSIGK